MFVFHVWDGRHGTRFIDPGYALGRLHDLACFAISIAVAMACIAVCQIRLSRPTLVGHVLEIRKKLAEHHVHRSRGRLLCSNGTSIAATR